MKLLEVANPVAVTKRAVHLSAATLGLVAGLVRGTAHVVLAGLLRDGVDPAPEVDVRFPDPTDAPSADPDGRGEVAGQAASQVTDDAAQHEVDGGAQYVLPPLPDLEPPVDVVGRALAAEAELGDLESRDGVGLAHEPRGASRDDEHGTATLPRAEAEGMADEATAALEGDVEVEAHLTQPLIDPGDVKAVAAEMRTMSRASDPDKG